MPACVFTATAPSPGAVAIIQIRGDSLPSLLYKITGVADWPFSRVRLVHFRDIDSGLAVMLRDDWAQLMPHGGPRVVQRIIEALIACGATCEADPPSRHVYPEAASDLEADMLAAIARAASPAAIDLLLQQPARWSALLADAGNCRAALAAARDDAALLQRMVDPPAVVVIGQPNVGKSTLTNRMLGRAASIVADLPGTTRDWVAGLAEIGTAGGASSAIAVRWTDTPGLRQSDDAIEQRAIEQANQVIAAADVLIVMRDPLIDWPKETALPRTPDVWVMNKMDRADAISPRPPGSHEQDEESLGMTRRSPLSISAETGANTERLEQAVLGKLGLARLPTGAIAFSAGLSDLALRGDLAGLRKYCGV